MKKLCVCIHCGGVFAVEEWPDRSACPNADGCGGGAGDRVLVDADKAEDYADFYRHG